MYHLKGWTLGEPSATEMEKKGYSFFVYHILLATTVDAISFPAKREEECSLHTEAEHISLFNFVKHWRIFFENNPALVCINNCHLYMVVNACFIYFSGKRMAIFFVYY